MASSLGRLALGVVGALIGAPFGLAAVGFAIGSAIGGFLFAPEGPTVEGPRLGDTDVTASSLGKVIPFHYGVTRSGGNVFWSAGLKEIKKEEDVGGGGKGGGGGGGTQITYEYYASFAAAFGRGPAEDVLRMWADGKLIYDATGTGGGTSSSAPTFNFRFVKGGAGTTVDPLIKESINRRLAGQPDINEGNGPQSDYRTMNDLIAETSASGDPRSAIYTSYLTALKNNAEAGGAEIPDYQFTPAYKELCYIVFDDMPLADFGNRIPNITAEIVWTSDAEVTVDETTVETQVNEISADTTPPTSAMGVDRFAQAMLIKSGTRIRRFSASGAAETFEREASQTLTAPPEDPGQSAKTVTSTVQSILAADSNGDFFVRLSRTGETTAPILGKVANSSLEILGGATGTSSWYSFTVPTMTADAATITHAASAGRNGDTHLMIGCTSAGRLYMYDVGGEAVGVAWGDSSQSQPSYTGIGDGPMVPGGGKDGDTNTYWLADDGANWRLYKINAKFGNNVGFFGSNNTLFNLLNAPQVSVSTLDSGTVGTEAPRSVVYDEGTGNVLALFDVGGAGRIKQYDPDAAGNASDPYLQYSEDLTLSPPNQTSGMQRSSPAGSFLGYADGNDACLVNTTDGSETLMTNVLSGSASADAQIFVGNASALYTWIDGVPYRIQFEQLNRALYATDLSTVVTDICRRTGMQADEYDVSDIASKFDVRGYTIARASSGRKALENLLLAYFVDGIETDWQVKFVERTTSSVRTIQEDELGPVKSPTGDVALMESRQPEYDLPSEIAMIYTDQDRDYQQGSAHYRRTAQPAPVMHSHKTENLEMPLVLLEHEARDIAQRLMFLTWMSRDTSKMRLAWTHADLDPSDVISIQLKDGRTLTDRIGKVTMGANFEIEAMAARSGDPVYTQADMAAIGSSNIPTTSIQTPAFAKMFVFDIPLIYDYHDTGRASNRYYMAVGSDTQLFISADIYGSLDNSSFIAFNSATVDVTWGQIVGNALAEPRSLWTTDTENEIRVSLSVDNGDVNSITIDQLLNGGNLALIWNQSTGVGEMIQFKDVVDNGDGTVTLSHLIRGRRGTDWAVGEHQTGEFFILLTDAAVLSEVQSLSLLGTTQYFKAVSRGNLIGATPSITTSMTGADLKPYAPSHLERSDDGSDLTVTWNRRSRLGGEWNMVGTGVETVPLNEDSEAYQFFILPNMAGALDAFDPNNAATYVERRDLTSPTTTITAADLGTFGYALLDDFQCAVYQVSAQVGRGFPRIVSLAA